MAIRKPKSTDRTRTIRWGLLTAYLVSQFFTGFSPGVGVLVYLAPAVFAVLHSLVAYGKRDTIVTFAIIAAVSFAFEAVGTNTGFPFGEYLYPGTLNGPELFGVPPLLPLVYVSMGYACFWLARIIIGQVRRIRPADVLALAGLAAMMMVLWDLSIDPTASTVEGRYIWEQSGPYFGVPFANFTGWFLNCFTFFLLVGTYLSSRFVRPVRTAPTRRLLIEPLVFFGITVISAMRPLLFEGTITDISQSMTLVALFAMGFPLLVAAIRLPQLKQSG